MDMPNIVLPEIDVAACRIVTCTIEGILEEEDILAMLGADHEVTDDGKVTPIVPRAPSEPHNLKRIKERHHGVARLIASGMNQRIVAAITNYNEQYLSVLLSSPAMEELVELYRVQYGKSAEIITEKLRTVGTQALERLGDRIEELDDNALIQVAKLGLDRAGHGPSSSHHLVEEKHLVDHAELTRLNLEARKGSSQYISHIRDIRKELPAPEKDNEEELPQD